MYCAYNGDIIFFGIFDTVACDEKRVVDMYDVKILSIDLFSERKIEGDCSYGVFIRKEFHTAATFHFEIIFTVVI